MFKRNDLILLIVWYFSQGRTQIKYIKEKYGNDYEKKKWGKPLLLGFCCMVGYVIFSIVVAISYNMLFSISF